MQAPNTDNGKSRVTLTRKTFCKQMCAYGMFSEQIPPCFNSTEFAKHADRLVEITGERLKTEPTTISIYKTGVSRRMISVPNPYGFSTLVKYMGEHWNDIRKAASSPNSHSPITYMSHYNQTDDETINSEIAREATHSRSDFISNTRDRIIASLGFKYRLSIDIATCYNSIYTHSITWALCGKKLAKQYWATKEPEALKKTYDFANQLDKRTSALKNDETNGILTGPFTSRIISEIILSGIDAALRECRTEKGAPFVFRRYVDDYKFYFRSQAEAQSAIAEIERHLNEYNLSLNQSKIELQEYPFDTISSMKELLDGAYLSHGVFGLLNAASMLHASGEKGAYKYALKIARGKSVAAEDREAVLAMLFNINLVNPKYGKYIVDFVKDNREAMGAARLAEIVDGELEKSLDGRLEQEVANLLYFVKELDLQVRAPQLTRAIEDGSDFARIIALDLWRNCNSRVIRDRAEAARLNKCIARLSDDMQHMSMDGEHWLLLYESKRHGLLKNINVTQGKTAPFFDTLDELDVSFYE